MMIRLRIDERQPPSGEVTTEDDSAAVFSG